MPWLAALVCCSAFDLALHDAYGHLLAPRIAGDYHWLRHVTATLVEILFSFLATAAAGILVAILVTWSDLLSRLITPIIALFNSLPIVAIAPIILLWFGYGLFTNV